jgi:luciferase family oxidoreductase group 1
MKMGVLDIGLTLKGNSDDVNELISSASLLENLGYSRFWLAEHFSPTSYLLNNEITLSLLCRQTKKIRIGTAGVLLLLNNPYRVALNYKLLESLYPGRIDLGIARGITSPTYSRILLGHEPNSESYSVNQYEKKITELLNYLKRSTKREVPIDEIIIPPFETASPPLWLLGTTATSSELAIKYKTNYSLSLFHNHSSPMVSLNKFKDDFYKVHHYYPEVSIAIAGTCSNDEKKVVEALNKKTYFQVYSLVAGSPDQCKEQILKLKASFEADEIIFLDVAANFEDKVISYGLLSDAFDLSKN